LRDSGAVYKCTDYYYYYYQRPVYTAVLYNSPLLCGFNVSIKGLVSYL